MAKPKPGLGRGLDALLSGASDVMSAQRATRVSEESIALVPIDSIIPNPRQPRRAFREDDAKLLELSVSIKQHGMLQPLVVARLDSSEVPSSGWFSEGKVILPELRTRYLNSLRQTPRHPQMPHLLPLPLSITRSSRASAAGVPRAWQA